MARRGLVVGVARSGTTWISQILAAHPDVTLVHEPDNEHVSPMASWGTARFGRAPSLRKGDEAPEYAALFRTAFRGRIPVRGRRLRLASKLRVPAVAGLVPRAVKGDGLILVKSVGAYLSLEWMIEQFSPSTIVLWRHPLNVLASWLEIGWRDADFATGLPAIRERFEQTALWPPPANDVMGLAWSVCASMSVLLESAVRTPALIRGHEQNALQPREAVASMLDHLGLVWAPEIDEAIALRDAPGSGWVTERLAADEPLRWRDRLKNESVTDLRALIDRFQDESPVAAEAWTTSPAVHP